MSDLDRFSREPATLLMRDVPSEVQRLTGVRPTKKTVWRWRRYGVRGVRLHAVRVGGRFCTSPLWIQDFLGATKPETKESVKLSGPAMRANDRAKAELVSMGVL